MYEDLFLAFVLGFGVGGLLYAYERKRNWKLPDITEALDAVEGSPFLQKQIKKALGADSVDFILSAVRDKDVDEVSEEEETEDEEKKDEIPVAKPVEKKKKVKKDDKEEE